MLHKSLYELAGGEPAFRTLVERFYARVAGDPVLRRVYPDEDLSGATERLTLFLIQYWGGPSTYSEQRGHPRLRMRHQPFAIGRAERDAWLEHMTAAVESLDRGTRGCGGGGAACRDDTGPQSDGVLVPVYIPARRRHAGSYPAAPHGG